MTNLLTRAHITNLLLCIDGLNGKAVANIKKTGLLSIMGAYDSLFGKINPTNLVTFSENFEGDALTINKNILTSFQTFVKVFNLGAVNHFGTYTKNYVYTLTQFTNFAFTT